MQITTVTSKGQVTIPKELRDELGLKAGAKVAFEKKGKDRAEIKTVPDFFSLKGSVKVNRSITKAEEKKTAQEYVAKRYLAKKKKIERYG